MTETTDRRLVLTRVLSAPRDVVYRAWTEPESLAWFLNPSEPVPEEPITVDLRVGGQWRLHMDVSEELKYFTGGVYREIVPGEKLVFAWGAVDGWPEIDPEHPENDILVTVTLGDLGDQTEMRFEVELPATLSADEVRGWFEMGIHDGWSMTIDRLVTKFA